MTDNVIEFPIVAKAPWKKPDWLEELELKQEIISNQHFSNADINKIMLCVFQAINTVDDERNDYKDLDAQLGLDAIVGSPSYSWISAFADALMDKLKLEVKS